jgi:hypothetical protein
MFFCSGDCEDARGLGTEPLDVGVAVAAVMARVAQRASVANRRVFMVVLFGKLGKMIV